MLVKAGATERPFLVVAEQTDLQAATKCNFRWLRYANTETTLCCLALVGDFQG